MPPIKGKKRRLAPLRCYDCGSTKVRVERGSNSRSIHGVKKTVANCICENRDCQNEWLSSHPDAIKAMREADQRAKVSKATTVVIDNGTIRPQRVEARANPLDIDRTER